MNFEPPSAAIEPARPGFIERWAFPILLFGLVCATGSPIFVRLSEVGPVATAAERMIVPIPLFLGLLLFNRDNRIPISTAIGRRDVWLLILAGVFFAGDLAFWNWSVVLTSVANATVLANLTPVFVVLATWLFFKERFAPAFLLGLMLAVGGTAVMMIESLNLSAQNFTGDISAIITSWFYGGYLITVSRVRQRVSTVGVMAVSGTVAAIVLFAVAYATEDQMWPHAIKGWMALAGMVVIVQLAGQTLIALSLRHVSAGLSSLMLLMQPVLPAIAAWILFDESLSVWQLLGAVGIFGGLVIARRSTRPSPVPA